MADPKLIVTGDGSHSLYLREMNETYHSTHGALTESRHVFLKEGVLWHLSRNTPDKLEILEVGFGTGLNVLMMLDFARAHPEQQIRIVSLEPYPLSEQIYQQLNFADLLENVQKEDIKSLHRLQDEEVFQDANFHFQLHVKKVEDLSFEHEFDLVFFDAFAPNKQSEIWNLPVLQSMHIALKSHGSLVTYCAQGAFKRNLVAAGFEMETLEGPPGKKEMVRGVKK